MKLHDKTGLLLALREDNLQTAFTNAVLRSDTGIIRVSATGEPMLFDIMLSIGQNCIVFGPEIHHKPSTYKVIDRLITTDYVSYHVEKLNTLPHNKYSQYFKEDTQDSKEESGLNIDASQQFPHNVKSQDRLPIDNQVFLLVYRNTDNHLLALMTQYSPNSGYYYIQKDPTVDVWTKLDPLPKSYLVYTIHTPEYLNNHKFSKPLSEGKHLQDDATGVLYHMNSDINHLLTLEKIREESNENVN